MKKTISLHHVQELTPYLEKQLDKLVDKYPVVAARRGKGFMQGLVITGTTVGSIVTKALENGLLVISAGSDVLRLVPPLVITKENIDEMVEKLERAWRNPPGSNYFILFRSMCLLIAAKLSELITCSILQASFAATTGLTPSFSSHSERKR